MKTFIQLKDGIGWASVNSMAEVEGSIEVDFGTGDFYLKKKYEDGLWSNADLIHYAEVNEQGEIIEIKRTYFISEVDGPVMNIDTNLNFKWVNGQWVSPTIVQEATSTVQEATTTVQEVVPEPTEPS